MQNNIEEDEKELITASDLELAALLIEIPELVVVIAANTESTDK